MCSYCGCEAEPLIEALMVEHSMIADLTYRLRKALDAGDTGAIATLTADLAERFRVHSLREEIGLFAEMSSAGEALSLLAQMVQDHRRLRPLFASPQVTRSPARLQAALSDLARHAETEDNDLFPFALQVLPSASWDRINTVSSFISSPVSSARSSGTTAIRSRSTRGQRVLLL